jgi:hypothetical protein
VPVRVKKYGISSMSIMCNSWQTSSHNNAHEADSCPRGNITIVARYQGVVVVSTFVPPVKGGHETAYARRSVWGNPKASLIRSCQALPYHPGVRGDHKGVKSIWAVWTTGSTRRRRQNHPTGAPSNGVRNSTQRVEGETINQYPLVHRTHPK